MTTPPRIVLTPGEPVGVGPDLCVGFMRHELPAELVAIADRGLLEERARQLGVPAELQAFDPSRPPEPGRLKIHHEPLHAPAVCGHPDSRNAPYVLRTLERAVQGCQQGVYRALVTGPVHKGVINDAGIPFTGHTEFLAGLTGTPRPVMMLATKEMRVALATTHLPLRAVADAITSDVLRETLEILHADLQRRFAVPQPRILVCGLNPHAGEGGHLGREELDTIEPALEALRARGMRLYGPLAADTAFTPRHVQRTDAVLAMYHDQGLPVLKYAGFGSAVNITLGLPIIRTSVDHGTALNLAGTGKAEGGSLEAAIRMALDMVRAEARVDEGARVRT